MSDGVLLTPALHRLEGAEPPRRARSLQAAEPVPDAALAWRDGLIVYAGPADDLPSDLRSLPHHTTEGAVVPGFVDSHTHLPFFGWRADEFRARLAGKSYRDLHGGGGIFRSRRLLAEASDDDVIKFGVRLADEMLAAGTTALELKTGYGLSLEGELRQARLARRLAGAIRQTAVVTLLACHAVPEGMTRERWVDVACDELIPAAAAEGLADAVDVYVEDIAFSVADLERVAAAAAAAGLPLRCHADQLGPSGAAEAAVRLGARSADHLNNLSPDGVAALAGAPATVATLLPVSTLFLRARKPPVADLLSSGAVVAIATDFNPGTSPCCSMIEAIVDGVSLYELPVDVALTAATINPAWTLGLDHRLGSLGPGKRADFVVLDSSFEMVPYRPGHNPVAEAWIAGERVDAA